MISALVVIAIAVTGWALGRSRPRFNLVMVVFAMFGAVTAHSGFQWAFVDGRFHDVLGDPRQDASAAVVLPIAAIEALGLWLPVLFIPWAQAAARICGALYVLLSAVAAAVAFYFPDELISMGGMLSGGDGPPYLLAVFGCVPIAAIGYASGWMRARDDDFSDRDDPLMRA